MGGGLSTSFGFQNAIEGEKKIPVSLKNFRLSLREIRETQGRLNPGNLCRYQVEKVSCTPV